MTGQVTRNKLTTNQAIFDYGFDRILKQGGRSMNRDESGGCAYNNREGTRHCIAGHIMSAEARRIGDNCSTATGTGIASVTRVLRSNTGVLGIEGDWLKANAALLYDMQCLHDDMGEGFRSPRSWLSKYDVVVSQEKLDQWYEMAAID